MSDISKLFCHSTLEAQPTYLSCILMGFIFYCVITGGMGTTYSLSRTPEDFLCNVDEGMDMHDGKFFNTSTLFNFSLSIVLYVYFCWCIILPTVMFSYVWMLRNRIWSVHHDVMIIFRVCTLICIKLLSLVAETGCSGIMFIMFQTCFSCCKKHWSK